MIQSLKKSERTWCEKYRSLSFSLEMRKKLIKTLKRDWLKKIELMMFLLKKFLVNHHQKVLTIEYYDKYLKLKVLISNENDLKDSSD